MNKYQIAQISCLLSAGLALGWHFLLPGFAFDASYYVDVILGLLQFVLIPNVFLSLACAIMLLDARMLKGLCFGFVSILAALWLTVSAFLLGFWWLLFDASKQQVMVHQLDGVYLGVTALLPLVMVFAIMVGWLLPRIDGTKRYQDVFHKAQVKVAYLFESVYVLIPCLVFFVMLNFMQYAQLEHLGWVLRYVGLSVVFISSFIFVVLPLCYRYYLGVKYFDYFSLIWPVAFMTFVAGDSLAAIPMIAQATDKFGSRSDMRLASMLTMVVICFPWLGELANLIFPVYGAAVEAYSLNVVLQILGVGPFFMFTDPLISMPALLKAFSFPEAYQSAYLTMAIFTDHMFEASEAIAVLLVCARLKVILTRDNG